MQYRILMLILLLCLAAPLHAKLVFSAPPRESAEKAEQIYGPLAQSLSELLGQEVVFERADNFITYSVNIQKDKYDLVFDGPHFAAWRVEHYNHEVLAKLPGKLDFYVATLNPDYKTLDDLIGRKVCALLSPNLGTVAFLNAYKNPMLVPKLAGSTGGFAGVASDVFSGRCDVGVFRTAFFDKKLTEAQRSKLRIIHTTKPMPNQAITASPRLNRAQKDRLVAALTNAAGAQAASKLFSRFSKKSKHFMPASGEEYADLNLLLEGVVWGW